MDDLASNNAIKKEIITAIPGLTSTNSSKLNCIINNNSFSFLIDTGASVSLIKRSAIRGTNISIRPLPNNYILSSISGDLLPVIGTAEISIFFQGRSIMHSFIICENNLSLATDGLLGLNFLRTHNVIINYSKNQIQIGTELINIATINNKILDVNNILLNNTAINDPGTVDSSQFNLNNNLVCGDNNVEVHDTCESTNDGKKNSPYSTKWEEDDSMNQADCGLNDSKMFVDQEETSLEEAEEIIRIVERTEPTSEDYSITLKEPLTIPPRTEAVCIGIRKNTNLDENILIEPAEIHMDGIIAPRILSRGTKKEVTVKIMNVTNSSLIIPSKTVIGFDEPVQNIDIDAVLHLHHLPANSRTFQVNFNTAHLKPTDQIRLQDLISEYQGIFTYEGCTLGSTSKISHRIITENVHPIARAPYRVPVSQREVLQSEIGTLLQQNIIEESTSPWSAPVVLVNKIMADGNTKIRLCIDYRMLNAITKKDYLPLPNLQETIEQLNGAALFSTLDLASGYHQVAIAKEDIEKTAFSTPWGHYEWNRMPFGLCNAPSTFQRLMYCVLSGLTNESCYVYLDDIIVFSKNDVNEHIQRLRDVFDRLRKNNLKLKPSKCRFIEKEVSYLVHLLTQEGAKPDRAKTEAICTYPVPRNVKDIRAFLGLVGFYRRFIKNFSKIAKPITKLLQKEEPFLWNQDTTTAFEELRTALFKSPVLAFPDFSQPFIIATDASNFALGAVLSQLIDGKEHPIAYASRTLNKAETNYTTTEKECLGVVWAVKSFRCYVYGRRFTIITDHRPLRWLMNLKDPSSRLGRWALILTEHEFDIVHRPGKQHGNSVVEMEPIWDREKSKMNNVRTPKYRKL